MTPRRSRLKGRAVLNHLPDHVPATEPECYALLRQAVAVYQNLYPALWRRFRRGSTSGRSGLETQFLDASGRITPESVRNARISVQEDKLAADLRGLSPRQTVFHMEHALGEEVRHHQPTSKQRSGPKTAIRSNRSASGEMRPAA